MADERDEGPGDETLARIRALEQTVEQLSRDVAELRADLYPARSERAATRFTSYQPASERSAFTRSSAAVGASAARQPKRTFADFEALVGRYGMLALATVAALAGVGTFLSWMIARGLLSPGVRVSLGLLCAGALAVWGYRLRRRERSFGSSLLGLALAITHVCAWASGPSLQLVPPLAAFGLAAVASIALALFAHREHDEALWCVGFGGAAIAPFVTSDGRGVSALLAAYGAMVLLTGCFALRRRSWQIAERTLALSAALYVGALAMMPERDGAPLMAVALSFAVALGGALPFAAHSRLRARLRALGALGAAASLRAAIGSAPVVDPQWIAVGLGIAGVAWLALVDHVSALPESARVAEGDRSAASTLAWFDALFIPAAFLVATLVASNALELRATWTLVAATVTWSTFVARRPAGHLRDASALAASLAALLAVYHASVGALWATAGCAVTAVAFVFAHRVWPSRSWLLMSVLTLVGTAGYAVILLTARPAYQYWPFLTPASLVALVVSASWLIVALLARTLASAQRSADAEQGIAYGQASEREMDLLVKTVRGVAAIVPFVWVNLELAYAVSPTVARLLVISYYASSGVVCVGMGRRFESAALRRVGLGLAVLAALVAFQGASRIEAVAARIAGYLVTAVFLLGIAYWYRRPGAEPESEESDVEPELVEASRS